MSRPVASFTLPSLTVDQVPMVLFRRHVGLPACAELDERLEALFDQAKTWYTRHGQPWTEARQISIQRIVYDVIHLEHQSQLSSALLARGLARAAAYALVVVAVSAGKAVDEHIDLLWKSGRVDEAMFLNAYAIATVEHLRWRVGDQLRRTLNESETTVLPHYSPGYDGWDLTDQSRLFRLFCDQGESDSPPLEILPSGGMIPSKSTLAAFGITQRRDFDKDLDQFWSCPATPASTVRSSSSYAFPKKALSKWRDKRLRVTAEPNNELLAIFRFDGSTCTNMGLPLAFDYKVRLKREQAGGHRILSSSCEPAEEHLGYQNMCAFLDKPKRYMTLLRAHQPLVGQPLSEVLAWQSPTSPAGCLCTRASQDHKWRIVLQTLHFALEDQ
ncbi:MAG: hypothetical protein ABGX16_14370 [Pirellulales bacterium]